MCAKLNSHDGQQELGNVCGVGRKILQSPCDIANVLGATSKHEDTCTATATWSWGDRYLAALAPAPRNRSSMATMGGVTCSPMLPASWPLSYTQKRKISSNFCGRC